MVSILPAFATPWLPAAPTVERVESGEEEELGQQEGTEGEEGQGPGGAKQHSEAQHSDSVPAGLGTRCLLPSLQSVQSPQSPGQYNQVEQGHEATVAHDQDTVYHGVAHPAPAGQE